MEGAFPKRRHLINEKGTARRDSQFWDLPERRGWQPALRYPQVTVPANLKFCCRAYTAPQGLGDRNKVIRLIN